MISSFCLFGSSLDKRCAAQAEVSNEDAEALTRELRLRFYRTCVKDNLNVSEGNEVCRAVVLHDACVFNTLPSSHEVLIMV